MDDLIKKIWTLPGGKVPPPYERGLKVVLSSTEEQSLPFTFLVSTVYPEGGKTAHHTHEDHGELMYIQSGRGKAILGDITFDIEPDVVFFAPAGVPHQILNDGQDTIRILCTFIPGLPPSYVEEMQQQARQKEGEP